MINERGGHIWRPILTKLGVFATQKLAAGRISEAADPCGPSDCGRCDIADLPDRRINRWPSSGGGSYSDDDGGSYSLNWIEIDNSASDSSIHSGGGDRGGD
jgi:hypothetical protein